MTPPSKGLKSDQPARLTGQCERAPTLCCKSPLRPGSVCGFQCIWGSLLQLEIASMDRGEKDERDGDEHKAVNWFVGERAEKKGEKKSWKIISAFHFPPLLPVLFL